MLCVYVSTYARVCVCSCVNESVLCCWKAITHTTLKATRYHSAASSLWSAWSQCDYPQGSASYSDISILKRWKKSQIETNGLSRPTAASHSPRGGWPAVGLQTMPNVFWRHALLIIVDGHSSTHTHTHMHGVEWQQLTYTCPADDTMTTERRCLVTRHHYWSASLMLHWAQYRQ